MMWPFRPTDRRILDLRRKLQGMTAVATQLRADKAKADEANKTLRRLVNIGMSVRDSALSERDEAKVQLASRDADVERLTQARNQGWVAIAERDELIVRMEAELTGLRNEKAQQADTIRELDADLAEACGRLAQAEEELAEYQRAEAVADEARAKRYYDGIGDQ